MLADLLTAIAALIGAICGIGSLIISRRNSMASAKRDEVETLRCIIAELRARVAELEREAENWRNRYRRLANFLRSRDKKDWHVPHLDEDISDLIENITLSQGTAEQ